MDKFVKRVSTKDLETRDIRKVPIQNGAVAGKNSIGTASNLLDSNSETESQCLEFASPLLSGEYRLLEISPALADRIMTAEQLVIRGDPEDSCVLCTHDTTFDVKEVVTSNVLLLLPEFHFNNEANANSNKKLVRKVIGMKSNFMELQQLAYVPVQRLKEKLHESELEWDDKFNTNIKLYTVGDLLDIVQISEAELHKSLECMPVITLNGYLRMLSAEFHDRLVTVLVDCLDDDEEPGIILESVGLECLKEAMRKNLPDKNIPVEAFNWLIKTYCDVVEENGTETHHINEKAICRAKISQLLRAAVKFEYDTFEKALQQILPVGVEFKEYLEGLAFIDDELATGKTIRYLNVDDLPEEPVKRLELLFTLRQSWEEPAIKQYLNDICPTKRYLNELLINCCRQATTRNGEKILVGLKETLL